MKDERAPSGDPLVVHLHSAGRRRLRLLERTDAVRLHDAELDAAGAPAALAGATIERFGDFAVLNTYAAAPYERRLKIAEALEQLGAAGTYLKVRARADLRRLSQKALASNEPIRGQAAPEELVVSEHGMQFLIRLGDGLSTGLFLDQRDNRSSLREGCRGVAVLNLFAYTCSFSVAAGVGGASKVTSVDLAQAALSRGDQNLRLNQLPKEQHRLLKADARKWLERAVRRGERFGRIVLDPPSFANVKGDAFSVAKDYAALVEQCVHLLEPGGRLLAVLNHRKTSELEFEQLLRACVSASKRTLTRLEMGSKASDCAQGGDSGTKSAWLWVQ